jgi:hypothetical protein
MLRLVRQWFATYGEMNFKRWGVTDSDHAPATPMMYGWRKPVHGDEHNSADELVRVETGRVWYVLADAFRCTVPSLPANLPLVLTCTGSSRPFLPRVTIEPAPPGGGGSGSPFALRWAPLKHQRKTG